MTTGERQTVSDTTHLIEDPAVRDADRIPPATEKSGWVDLPPEATGEPAAVDPASAASQPGTAPGYDRAESVGGQVTAPADAAGQQFNGPSDAQADRQENAPVPGRQAAPRDDADESLFAENEATTLRGQWTDVQAGFVDDPKQCVHQADALVSEVVERLTANLAQARSRLEEQWASGAEASTEDLRVALKRYREFFDRLLAA